MTTRIFFTGKVDPRYAWIGNDAEGSVDILTELSAIITAAKSSIAVSTMTFNYTTEAGASSANAKVEEIAALLSEKAKAGVDVRIMANGGHRFQTGYFRALRGPVHLADNNLPALVQRISFQRSTIPAPAGFLVDSGLTFGPRGNGQNYGWDQDVSVDINAHGTPDATFTSPLLKECYAHRNSDGPRKWSIDLPEGYYYVLAVTGEAAYSSKSFVLAQGETIFFRKGGSNNFEYFDHTNTAASEFDCSTVRGGKDDISNLPLSRRLHVPAGGKLEITIGKLGETGYSSLNYVEIYRGDSNSLGNLGLDKTRIQKRALHHSKFVLVDEGTADCQLWTGSHNLTPVDPKDSEPRSEDAILTDEVAIASAFRAEFDQWWGSASGTPNANLSANGIFKVPVFADGTMAGLLPGYTASWSIRFSPSKNGAGGVNLYQTIVDFLGPSGLPTEDIFLLVEQITDGGTYSGSNGTFPGLAGIVSLLLNKVQGGTMMRALIGDASPTESIFTTFSGVNGAKVVPWKGIHDKIAIVDALGDNLKRARGRALCGSMNWSQGAMHVNDEQTLILSDPAIANQFLQRALYEVDAAGIQITRATDCVIVVDRSYSMNEAATFGTTKIAAARLAAKVFLDIMGNDGSHRLALVRFGSDIEPFSPPSNLEPFTAAKSIELASALDTIEATLPIGNSTCYGKALQKAYSLLTTNVKPNSRRLVVFLTDGKENSAPMAETVYPAMAADGIEIHTTSFGVFDPNSTSGPNAILYEMANVSGGTFAQVDNDVVNLQKRFAEVARDALGMTTILDPTWTLRKDRTLSSRFPVDMSVGRLVIVLLWGEQKTSPEQVEVKTSWGESISERMAGVERRRRNGSEVWRIDLAKLSGMLQKEVRGWWSVSARSPGDRLHAELCVFATNTGIGHLVFDLREVRGKYNLFTRVFGGKKIAENAKIQAVHLLEGKKLTGSINKTGLKKMQTNNPRFRGVSWAKPSILRPGVHEIAVVAEGETLVKAKESNQPEYIGAITVPFRREHKVRIFVPAKERRKEVGS